MKKSFLYLCMCALFVSSCSDDSFVTEDVNEPTLRGVVNKSYYSLGVSYDVTYDYLDIDATKYPVVDIEAFLKSNANSYITNPTTKGDVAVYSGATAEEFINEIKTKNSISLKGSVAPLPGSSLTGNIKGTNEFNSKTKFSTKYSHSRADVLKRVKRVYLNANPTMLQKYLYPEFTRDLNALSPDEFVKMYGTHILLDITIGGRLQFNYRSTIEEASSTTEKKKTVEAGLKFAVGEFGADRENSHTKEEIKTWNRKNATWKTWVNYIGGEGSGTSLTYSSESGYPTTSFNLNTWESSVNDKNAGLIEINWDKTYPIYDFITDVNKKAQIKAAVERYIKSKQIEQVEVLPLHRFYYSRGKNTHYVTTAAEITRFKNEGHDYEGVIGYIFKTQQPNTVPFHKFYYRRGGNTHYVTTAAEVTRFKNEGHEYEGIIGYIYKSDQIEALPLHKFYYRRGGNTHYVTTSTEVTRFKNEGHEYEGVIGYIFPLK